MKRIFTIPNLMSFFRICLIPVFAWLYLSGGHRIAALAVLAVSGLTDTLDGFVARRFNMVSDFGKILDPIADKLTQGVVLICMAARCPVLWIPAGLLVIKEALVGGTNLLVIRKTERVEGAKWHGKVTTVLLYATMLAHLTFPDMPPMLSRILAGLTSGFMLFSMAVYLKGNLRVLGASHGENAAR